jgi:hypothetical protein
MGPVKKVATVEVGQADNKKTVNDMCMSVGHLTSKPYPEPKTSGIKVRGTGAATKGTIARGPMA